MGTLEVTSYQANFVQRRRHRHALRLRSLVCTIIGIAAYCAWQGFSAHVISQQSSITTVADGTKLERVGLHPTLVAASVGGEWQQSSRLPFEPRVPSENSLVAAKPSSKVDLRYPSDKWRTIIVTSGDSLSLIFGRVGATGKQLQAVLKSDKKMQRALTAIEPGETMHFRIENGELAEFVFEPDRWITLHCRRNGDTYKVARKEAEPDVRIASATTEISHSLFLDGQKAGLPDKTIKEFIDIFGWDVDFLRELQRGDRFSVVFEELYRDGEKVGNGRVLAAQFINRNKHLRAVYYHNKNGVDGYFASNGDAMKKTFLRTPVHFTSISSRFSLARKHPILNTIRAHKGVDYAAPMGTPIQAVADGRAEFVGWQEGYGNVVVLKHGGTYSTLYGHMSSFARGLQKGESITQGQTIGFVGRTGLATGPHLHYEFRINGEYRDPLTIKFLNSSAIDHQYLGDFKRQTAPYIARLDQPQAADDIDKSMVAGAEDEAHDRARAAN